MVAASQRTSALHSLTGRPAVLPRSWGQPAGRSGSLARWAHSGALTRAIEGRSGTWLRGAFGRGAGASSDGFLYHMDWLEHVYSKVGTSGVSPPVHERSREDAHAQVLRFAWQVVGWFQRLLHESSPSICSLSH